MYIMQTYYVMLVRPKIFVIICAVILFIPLTLATRSLDFCSKDGDSVECSERSEPSVIRSRQRYILYDVNPPEGFNLRRDVYMRMAIFVKKMKKTGDWHLVLPPWGRLYHWQSADIGQQDMIPWSLFFDLPSLQRFAPVMEMHEFQREFGSPVLDVVYILQHYKDMWESNQWVEKFEVQPCHEKHHYSMSKNGQYTGWFWGYTNITAAKVHCLSFHGHASYLKGVLQNLKARAVMFDHAEVALHDAFGDVLYWNARRSMRFASALVKLAAEFRMKYLNSTDVTDGTVRPDDWTLEKACSDVSGGPYMCAHLRRKDFLWGRPKQVPSIAGAAKQIRAHLEQLGLTTVFVATDSPLEEFEELQQHLQEYQLLRYEPPEVVKQTYKDGGVAIIEQIICSHARFFSGTYESTFSFRIQEEREIMGFPPDSTFNRLCGDGEQKCSQPSAWRIVF